MWLLQSPDWALTSLVVLLSNLSNVCDLLGKDGVRGFTANMSNDNAVVDGDAVILVGDKVFNGEEAVFGLGTTPDVYARLIFGMLAFFLASTMVRDMARRLPQPETLSGFVGCEDAVSLLASIGIGCMLDADSGKGPFSRKLGCVCSSGDDDVPGVKAGGANVSSEAGGRPRLLCRFG